MSNTIRRALLAAALAALGAAAGCSDYLTGGDLSQDPNRPLDVTPSQLFVGVQSNIWALTQSDPARYAAMWTQQLEGTNQQYVDIYNYGLDESTTNGFMVALYTSGGLPDVRQLESMARASGDSTFLGVALVEEAMLVGTGADIFGDIPYSQALKGTANPAPDQQLAVYDSVQAVLSQAVKALSSNSSKNVGPGPADLVYGGDPARWLALAHTLKARYYLHTAEVRANAYQNALVEARQGITDPSGNYTAVYSGLPNQQNMWYQFDQVQRPGYLSPNPFFVDLLTSRNDPRLSRYFNADQSGFASALVQPNAPQPMVTANENLLIWAESAQRTGNDAEARTQLNRELALWGIAPVAASVSGQALLREILTEKYIALFQNLEVWNDYKRTCFPNVTPVVAGDQVPGRLFYDTAERQTNTSLLPPEKQPSRNATDLRNATDPFGNVCKGQ